MFDSIKVLLRLKDQLLVHNLLMFPHSKSLGTVFSGRIQEYCTCTFVTRELFEELQATEEESTLVAFSFNSDIEIESRKPGSGFFQFAVTY